MEFNLDTLWNLLISLWLIKLLTVTVKLRLVGHYNAGNILFVITIIGIAYISSHWYFELNG